MKMKMMIIKIMYFTKILTFYPKKIFIGKSPKIALTEFSQGYGPVFDGNSILLHIKNNKYIFIGQQIFLFESLNTITEFVSPVGNNDVPYPYAIDESGNYYLLTANVILGTGTYDKHKLEYDEPYEYYYDHSLITADMSYYEQPKQPKNKFRDIKEWYIGDNLYTFNYNPFPDYDNVVSKNEFFLVMSNGEKIVYSMLLNFLLTKAFGTKYFRTLGEKNQPFPVLPMTLNKNMTIIDANKKKIKLSKKIYDEIVKNYVKPNNKFFLPITITKKIEEQIHYNMYVVDFKGKKTKLSKEMYVELMNAYGKEHSFFPLYIKIIQNRL